LRPGARRAGGQKQNRYRQLSHVPDLPDSDGGGLRLVTSISNGENVARTHRSAQSGSSSCPVQVFKAIGGGLLSARLVVIVGFLPCLPRRL